MGLEKKGLGPKPHVSWGFSFAHWPSLPYLGWEWVLRFSSRSPQDWSKLAKCLFFPFPALAPLPQREQCWMEQERLLQALGMGLATGCGSSAAVRDQPASNAPLVQAQ